MKWEDIKRKLSSRKLWLAISEFVGMLIVALGYSEEVAVKIVALIMAGAGVLAYIIAEGLADAKAAAGVGAGGIAIAELVEGETETVEEIIE